MGETITDESSTAPEIARASDPGVLAAVEAVLVTAERAVDASRITDACGATGLMLDGDGVAAAIDALNAEYERTGRAFRVERVAGGWRLMTLAEHAEVVAAFHRGKQGARLSRAAIETLSIIAYRQPVTRATLEAIRGVACGEVLRSLLERKLIKIAGRAEELGRPMLYGTTKQFLETFGLASLKDLPEVGERPTLPTPHEPVASEPSADGSDAAEPMSREEAPHAEDAAPEEQPHDEDA
ncbi:MAG: SMC-Scp complex subunit ScpB [Planctomycetota bacterium]